MDFCSIPRKSATISRAERKAVSPLVMGAAITPSNSQHATDGSQPVFRNGIHYDSGIGLFHSVLVEKTGSRSSPDKRYDAFGNHSPIEYGTTMAFTRHATRH